MPIVQGPDGVQFSFPDGTDPATMHDALTQHYANVAANPTPVTITINYSDDKSIPIQPAELNAPGEAPAPKPFVTPDSSVAGSYERGVRDSALLGWGAPLNAQATVAGNFIGRALGINESNANYYDGPNSVYNQAMGQDKAQVAADQVVNPGSRFAGQIVGVVPTLAAPGATVAKGTNLLTKLAIGATNGAVYGGVAGAGNADPGNRIAGAESGAATGAVVGGAIAPAAAAMAGKAIGPVVRDFVGRVTGADAGNEGIAALARRTNLDPMAMADAQNAARAAGVPTTLTDVVPPQARSIIAKAGEDAPNGQALVAQATSRAADVQDRVANQAYYHIGGGDETAEQVGNRLAAARGDLSDMAYSAVRNDAIPLSPEVQNVLADPSNRTAVNNAIKLARTLEEKQGLQNIIRYARTPSPEVPPQLQGLSPAAQQQAMGQLGLTQPAPPTYTAGMAQRLNQSFGGLANKAYVSGDKAMGGNLSYLRRIIDDHATENSVGYRAANAQHAAMMAPANALETGSQFLGSGKGAVGDVIPKLAETQEDVLTTGPARVGAREAVTEAAGQGPTAALRVADKLSTGANQVKRNVALLGNEAGDQLANAMGLEAARVRNAAAAVPGVGGNPNVNPADIDAIIAHAATGGKSGLIYAARRFLSHSGMSSLNAQKLVEDATSQNPARVTNAINYVSKRMGSNRAGLLVNSLARVGGSFAGGTVGANQ